MHSNCILDSVANLLVRQMVFVGNIQKSPTASHLKGLDPSLDFCCQGLAVTGIKEIRPEDQWSSGPVNAHLTPGPGIYFNAFIHVYSPRAGADNPLGTNVDVNRKPLSLCHSVASLKKEI